MRLSRVSLAPLAHYPRASLGSLGSRTAVASLIQHTASTCCPCHVCRTANLPSSTSSGASLGQQMRNMAMLAPKPEKEYAFEIAASNLRFGEGVTAEVGLDFRNLGAKTVGIFTDKTVGQLDPFKVAVKSLEDAGVAYRVFDACSIEPTDASWQEAIAWGRKHDFDAFLAVGGGSVIDTAKAANLFTVKKEASLFDYINAPIGKGMAVTGTLRPLIAIPTTAGTGSETTGSAIVDIPSMRFKTGIASRALKPTLGIVDSLNTQTCPRSVHLSSGLDVLFHSMESYTAIPYDERVPRPKNPIDRPAYQGRNPISDVFSLWALRTCTEMLPRVCRDPIGDHEARKQMLLAATFAGIGFGNAGVHLCHAASYPISSQNKLGPKYTQKDYEVAGHPIIPHGISVALTGPSVFAFTAPSSPDRHREMLKVFGDEGAMTASEESLGERMRETVAKFLDGLGGVPRGLKGVGYKDGDVESLVDGILPQARVINLAPNVADPQGEERREQLRGIINGAMAW